MDTRHTQTSEEKSSLHINLKTSLDAAEQVRQFLSNHRGFLFVLALGVYSAYKLASGKINKKEIPVINPNKPSLYGWYSADFPGGIKGMLSIIDHSLPINSKIVEKVKSGMTIGVLQSPIALLSIMLYAKSKPAADSPKEENKSDYYNFNDIRKSINALFDEFAYGGCAVIAFWSAFTKIGLKSNYAFAGSVLVTQTISSLSQKEDSRLATFTRGMIFSGLTLFHNGDLWPAATAHVANELLTVKLK